MSAALFGKQVLVLETEPIMSLDLVSALEQAGASVVVAPSVQRAREISLKRHIVVAVINLAASPEARALCKEFEGKSVPVVLHHRNELILEDPAWAIVTRSHAAMVAAVVRAALQRPSTPAKRWREHGLLQPRLG